MPLPFPETEKHPGHFCERECQRIHTQFLHSSFSQLDNSGNSAISVKGKGLTDVEVYI